MTRVRPVRRRRTGKNIWTPQTCVDASKNIETPQNWVGVKTMAVTPPAPLKEQKSGSMCENLGKHLSCIKMQCRSEPLVKAHLKG